MSSVAFVVHERPLMTTNAPLAPPTGILPIWVDRKQGAKIITERLGPISARTLERWPLKWRLFNGRAVTLTEDLIAVAQARLDEAPLIKGGCEDAHYPLRKESPEISVSSSRPDARAPLKVKRPDCRSEKKT